LRAFSIASLFFEWRQFVRGRIWDISILY
jgi:hypothetical protein